jgi:hypothetical protein
MLQKGLPIVTRRDLLKTASAGFGYMALAGLCTEAAAAGYTDPLAPKAPHHPPKAKRIIFLCMRGGPSHVDTFDYKPKLATDEGKTASTGETTDRNRGRKLLPSPFKFAQHGQSGLWLSELFPGVANHADDLCLINSMHTEVPNHPQSFLMLHTGEFRFTRPSVGSWLLYGLGTENRDLPGFITISPPAELGGAQNYGNAFLPAAYQGTRIGQLGTPVAQARVGNLSPDHLGSDLQRGQLELIQSMNQDLLDRKRSNAELEGVINSFELGFRMQRSLPKLMDITGETKKTLEMYGIGRGPTDDFGRQCLLARRFAEAGVRFIEVCHQNWDTHGGLKNRLTQLCGQIDQPIAALLADLKTRGLLKDTIVMWGGEFGRTPAGQGADGRDHNSAGFSMWLAGGGVKGGQRVGATDDYGAKAVDNKCHHHDLHATLLHLMGLNHQRLVYRYGGRDYSLTDIHGRVVKEVLA